MSDESELPPCGLYRTTRAIGEVPAGRLVYFHNHGDPGPGIYTPHEWRGNRARFHERGQTLASAEDARGLEPLADEGLYRVVEAFHCCDKRCRLFEPDTLVQLGYDGAATPILFTPQLGDAVITLPERGLKVDRDRIGKLALLKVASTDAPASEPPSDRMLH